MPAARRQTLELDVEAFRRDMDEVRADLDAARGPEDTAHLRRIVFSTHIASWLGWGLSVVGPNPLSVLLIAYSRSVGWTCVAHHVLHKGYDKVEGQPARWTSRGFAKGWRRWVQWPDVLEPDAWDREHNQLHHYRLGEIHDPDVVERSSAEIIQRPWIPMFARYAMVGIVASVWKWLVFAPSNRRELIDTRDGHKLPPQREPHMDVHVLMPWNRYGREIWLTSYLPYGALVFGLIPALFGVFGWWAALSALINSVLAEWLTNLHTFLIVATNHAGGDIAVFEDKSHSRGEFYIHQIAGSVNFRTGGLANDLFHGWLNYQIEHHVWPDLSMRQYAMAQPRVKAVCEAHGVPYLQHSVWFRLVMLARVMVGLERSPVLEIRDTAVAAAK